MAKGIRLFAAIFALVVFLAAPRVTAAANTYVYYAACGKTASAQPSHSCPKSSSKAAFFKSLDASVTYKVCVKYPSGQKLCANNQPAPKNALKINPITSSLKGTHKVTWFVGTAKIGSWSFQVV